ncbi:hypothetical protein LTR36_008318 [Oleoguttula mirabilis]|uniref:F-box domain-containing protein n=1 Tax=Oleoguttula mirabilis TaxID=1507867 RepID=A0AAV9J7M6_9PEZI|nr:hypothetical protein LTR36_008318 [Oleoguttula mirabilis]
MAAAPSERMLLALPAETLVEIAGLLDEKDLVNLRQCCRKLESATHDAFRQTFFTTRVHTYTSYGLQALADIATRPSLGRKITEVIFAVRTLDELLYGPKEFCCMPRTFSWDAGQSEKDLEQREAEAGAAWAAWSREMQALSENGQNQTLLRNSFQAFVKNGIHPKLVFTDCSSYRHGTKTKLAFGTKGLLRTLGPNIMSVDLSTGDASAAIRTALGAMASAQFCVETLGLGNQDLVRPSSINASAFVVSEQLMPRLITCLQSLHTLNLELGNGIVKWSHVDYSAFCMVMGAASQLQSLRLEWDGYEQPPESVTKDILNRVGDAITSTRLAHISLENIYANASSFVAFLGRRRGSLKRLELSFTAVTATQCWKDVLDWVVGNLSLDEVSIRRLHRTDGSALVDEGGEGDFVVAAPEDVGRGLTTWTQSATYIC